MGAADHEDIIVSDGIEEHTVNLGEIRMNYATPDPSLPALLLVPARHNRGGRRKRACACSLIGIRYSPSTSRDMDDRPAPPGRYTLDVFG